MARLAAVVLAALLPCALAQLFQGYQPAPQYNLTHYDVGTPPPPPLPPLPLLLGAVDEESSRQCTRHVTAQWDYETDVGPATQAAALESQREYTRFQRALWEIVRQLEQQQQQQPPQQAGARAEARALRLLAVVGPAALPPQQLDRYNRLVGELLAVFESATVCAYRDAFLCSLRLEPDLTLIMARSRDWDELQYVWKEFRAKTGFKVRDGFQQLVDISNQAARLNGFADTSEYWMFPYESASWRADVEAAWEQVRPLYEQLHAYVRRKLRDLYGPDKISRQAPLPAHILGNMWAQSWSNILDVTIPYPGKNFLDVGPEMLAQGYSPLSLFALADDFYASLNLSAAPPSFWERSLLEQPPDRVVQCQPSAWDFCDRSDYRIKMCARVTMTDLVTAHHEMGHLQYFLQYRDQPKVFRDAANPGLHEAVGDAVSLSVSSPQHLQTLGLLRSAADDLPHNVNLLFAQALDKLPFLPYALSLDLWRYDVFSGRTPPSRYNCDYWRLRERLTGVKPPLLRSEIDFDPGSKYHVLANIPYIKFFVSGLVQYQLHRAACRAAGQTDRPLHQCDVYRSAAAGDVLRRLMRPGASQRWQEVLRAATNDSGLDGSALRDYFRPLEDWLSSENLRTGEYVGWLYDGDYCKQSIETANLVVSGGYYNAAAVRRPAAATLAVVAAAAAISRLFFATTH